MNVKETRLIVLLAAIAAAVAGVIVANRKVAPAIELTRVTQPPKAPAISVSTPPAEVPAIETRSQIPPALTNVQPAANPPNIATQAVAPANPNGSLQDPIARVALSLVGADPDAEEYWMGAVFDPSLPDEERADLMEDLNEDGLSDPKHPGPEDLPLILNRMQLIEEVAPYADDFMAEHLGEAYKDLNNMLAGKPVQ